MNERVYNNPIERLRSPERQERLEVKKTVDAVLENLNAISVLDIGTGSGLFAEEFFNRGLKVSGVDINPDMLEAAKNYLPDCDFKLSPAEQLPYEDKCFDISFMGLVFHEADDHLKALREAKRVSRKSVNILEWYHKVEESGPPIDHRLSTEKVKELAREAGFTKTEVVELKNLVLYKLN